MNAKIEKSFLYLILFTTWIFFSYSGHLGRLLPFVGTIAIIFVVKLMEKDNYKKYTGLYFSIKSIIIHFLLLFTGYFVSSYIISNISISSFVYYRKINFLSLWTVFFYFQSFNEEIITGPFMLNKLKLFLNKFFNISECVLIVIVSIFFSLIHFVMFFRWSQMSCLIGFMTLINLFLFGLIRNHLILKYKNIFYSLALHLGWNYAFLGGTFMKIPMFVRLREHEMFNLYVGSNYVFFLCLLGLGYLIILNNRFLCVKKS